MKKRLDKSNNGQRAIVFISGSAGELDWVLPILDFLLIKDFNINIIFLSRHAQTSVEQNRMCNDFICQENSKIEVASCGGYFFEKIEHIGYLSYRIFLKLKIDKYPILDKIYNFYDKMFNNLFIKSLPSNVLQFEEEKCLFISEFPSLRRPRDIWIKRKFKRSIFFYCPHSPHIYAEDLDRKYPEPGFIDYKKKYFLLLGHPGDYFIINNGRELASPKLEKIFIGHPKYSDNWLYNLRETAKNFRSTSPTRNKTSILILSRGFGSYLDEESHNILVETTIKVIHKQISQYSLLVKKHPREKLSYWHNIVDKYPSVEIVNDHILQLATRADFVISFWGSGAMDCYLLGVPVIEYWDPNKHHKSQVYEGSGYTTIYRKLGIVRHANNEEELKKEISSLMSENYKISPDGIHPFFSELTTRSNQWNKAIEKILLSNNLINNGAFYN